MKGKKIIVLAVAVALSGALTVFLCNLMNGKGDVHQEQVPRERKLVREGKSKYAQRGRKTTSVRVNSIIKEREKPTFNLESEDEALLSAEQKAILAEIRKALDEENKKDVLRLVQKLQSSKEWPDGIPKAIKMAAIEALGWFGSSCLPEIVGFLADADAEVIESTIERFEEALSDIDMSDFERSKVLISAAKVIKDPDAMDLMMFELNNMRHSVAVDTIKQIMATGGDAAKSILRENIEFYTGEEGLDTPEKLDGWLKENPDGEDDEEFYGGTKDE